MGFPVLVTVFCVAFIAGCTSLAGDTRSEPEIVAISEARGYPEAGFWRFGPFTFLGKYRIEHEWVTAYPRASGSVAACSYAWEGETKDQFGRRAPIRAGLDMWEDQGVLYQKDIHPGTKAPRPRDMTDYVIGKYRPNAPGGPRYAHEALCTTAFDGIGNLFNLYLKKATLADLRAEDDASVKRMRFAKLLEPLHYEQTKIAGLASEKMTEIVALSLKGSEEKPIRWITEDIRLPIGEIGYVYQIKFTLSDAIAQNEPEKAARRRAYWQRVQDTFRIEPIR